jgi:predicted nucleic acid-binding protein
LTLFVVDASVVIKWYVPEADLAAAHALRAPGVRLAAPDLLFVETANVLWKLVRRGEMPSSEAIEIIERIAASPFATYSNESLARDALDLAIATGLTAYDASYVALAARLATHCLTADQKLMRRVAGTPAAAYVKLLTDYVL